MADFSNFPLQQALYQALISDITLMGMVAGVYDRPQPGTPFPYITFGNFTVSDWSTKTTIGMEYNMPLQVWSREGGRKEAAIIMECIHTVLNCANLTVDGQTLVMLRFASSAISLEADGWTYQGEIHFRAWLQADQQELV